MYHFIIQVQFLSQNRRIPDNKLRADKINFMGWQMKHFLDLGFIV